LQRERELEKEREREREREMKLVPEEYRKAPWTEQEDILVVNFVHLFGDRRWDFVAKVSGLKVEGET
jgi:myb proto-oncogene protein